MVLCHRYKYIWRIIYLAYFIVAANWHKSITKAEGNKDHQVISSADDAG